MLDVYEMSLTRVIAACQMAYICTHTHTHTNKHKHTHTHTSHLDSSKTTLPECVRSMRARIHTYSIRQHTSAYVCSIRQHTNAGAEMPEVGCAQTELK